MNEYCIQNKTIIFIFSFIKIEKEGIILKNSPISTNTEMSIGVYIKTYKYDNKLQTERELEIKTKNGIKVFFCYIYEIIKIDDRGINQGKITIFINKDGKNYKIMLFNSTKEILDKFQNKLISVKVEFDIKRAKSKKLISELLARPKKLINNKNNILINKYKKRKSNSKKESKINFSIYHKEKYNKKRFNELFTSNLTDINLKKRKEK